MKGCEIMKKVKMVVSLFFASVVYIERPHNVTYKYTRVNSSSPWIQKYISSITYISFWCESVSSMVTVKEFKSQQINGNIMYKTYHYRYWTSDGQEYPIPIIM